jgi:polar amino acid transport system substrate-binding protein
MKRNLLGAALALVLTFTAGLSLAGECTKLVITGHPEYPPVAWQEGAKIVGAAPDLIAQIGKELGIKVESRYFGSWAEAQAAVKNGKADLLFGAYYNDERAAYLNYVRPAFMLDPVVIVTAKGKGFPFAKREDLIGRQGVTGKGESFGSSFDAFMAEKLKVERADGVYRCFQTLLDGKADYMVVGKYPGIAQAAKFGIQGEIEVLGAELDSFEMFVAFSKKSPCGEKLMQAFSERIKAAYADGTVARLLDAAEARWEKKFVKGAKKAAKK